MIEVTGSDGRVHAFAEGTTQSQIDAALDAIYATPAAPAYDGPLQVESRSRSNSAQSSSLVPILGGALALAVIALIGVLAMMMTRDRPAPTAAQMPGAGMATVVPADQVPTNQVLEAVPAGPIVTPEAFAGFVTTKQGGNVTVRAQAILTSAQVAKLPHGAPIPVTGAVVMPDGLWRQVNVGGVAGYVKGEYISQTQPAAIAKAVPSAAVATPKMIPREFWGFATAKSSKSVNVRTSPSTSAPVSSSIPVGEYLYVVGEQGSWYLVEWKGKRGWTNSSYISREEPD